jgi:hypothetical protein
LPRPFRQCIASHLLRIVCHFASDCSEWASGKLYIALRLWSERAIDYTCLQR